MDFSIGLRFGTVLSRKGRIHSITNIPCNFSRKRKCDSERAKAGLLTSSSEERRKRFGRYSTSTQHESRQTQNFSANKRYSTAVPLLSCWYHYVQKYEDILDWILTYRRSLIFRERVAAKVSTLRPGASWTFPQRGHF